MTTECLPCEQQASLARQDIQGDVPDIDKGKSAEWSGPIGIEQQRTGDGRLIEGNALRWDTLPVPLRWAMQDFGAHDGAYVVGKINTIERIDYDEANKRLQATGRDALPESFSDVIVVWGAGVHDLGSEYGREAHRQVKEGLTPGISMDLDDIVIREDGDSDDFTIVEGRVRAATQVAIPAFEGARIAVSDVEVFDSDERLDDAMSLMGDDEDTFNWVEDVGGLPPYIKRIEKHLIKKGMAESHAIATAVNVVKKMCASGDTNFPGSQQVNAGSRAEACAAVADWEEKKARAKAEAAETVAVTASAVKGGFKHSWFEDPHLQGSTEWTVTDEGQVFGYLAMWGTCHIANPQGHGVCTQPPSSPSGYAYFNTQPVRTDEGFVHAGRLTMNTLHAGQRLSSTDTLHHYEHTGAVGAYVVAGEDEYGIWVAGAAHPDADLDALRAAPVSGDWRTIAGNLEMVATLSVNVPGFPIPRATALVAGGAVTSLVASGMVRPEERHAEVQQSMDLNDPAVLRDLRARFKEMDRADAAAALAAKVNRLAALEKVRRVSLTVGGHKPARRQSFSYNKDQWRMPRGNGNLSGRWIDMPDAYLKDMFKWALGVNLIDSAKPDAKAQRVLKKQTKDFVARGAEMRAALEAGDGDKAHEIAQTLSDDVRSWVDNDLAPAYPEGSLDDPNTGPARILSWTQEAADRFDRLFKDSDLSLLSEETDIDKRGTTNIGGSPEVAALMEIDPTDHEAQKNALEGMATGTTLEMNDGEFIHVIQKQADGTWKILSSGLADMEDPDMEPLTTDDLFMGSDVDEPSPIEWNIGDPDTKPQWADLYDEDENGEYRARVGVLVREHRTFAYNPDQWRVPKGNPEGGRWVDMPGAGLDDLMQSFEDIADRVDDGVAGPTADNLADAQNFAEQAADALRAGDGDAAKAAAQQADEALAKVEAAAQNIADGDAISDVEAQNLGDSLDVARTNVARVADSDLSLLGDEGIGGDEPDVDAPEGSDIGGEDKSVPGDAPDDVKSVNKAKSDARGDAPEGGEKIDLADTPPAVQQALDGGEDEEYFKSTKWPGMVEARWTDEDGETYVVAVADPDGNVVGTTSGGGNPYIVYNSDGSTGDETYTNLDDAVQSLPGSQPAEGMEGEDPFDEADYDAPEDDGRDDYWEGFKRGIPEDQQAEAREEFDKVLDEGGTIEDAFEAARGPQTRARNKQDSEDRDNYWEGFKKVFTDPDDQAAGRAEFDKVLDEGGSIDDALTAAREAGLASQSKRLDGPDADADAVENQPGGPKPPNGISQAQWDALSPEERRAVSDAIAGGKSPDEALGDVKGPDASGSAQQKASTEAQTAASTLEGVLVDVAESEDGGVPPEDTVKVGDALNKFRDAMDRLDSGVQDGAFSAPDLTAARDALQQLEATMMYVADKPGLSDENANSVGVALDDMFDRLGNLAGLLQGETKPPPFAARKYVRQWLGRRGIRVGKTPTILV
jgi:hypothetical protein